MGRRYFRNLNSSTDKILFITSQVMYYSQYSRLRVYRLKSATKAVKTSQEPSSHEASAVKKGLNPKASASKYYPNYYYLIIARSPIYEY